MLQSLSPFLLYRAMILLNLLFIFVEFASASSYKVVCANEDSKSKANSFTLIAKLNLDTNMNRINTKVLVYLQNEALKSGPQIIDSQGFYRYVEALGGYKQVLLIPTDKDSKILNINLKLDIQSPLKSSIELNQTEKYFSDCYTL